MNSFEILKKCRKHKYHWYKNLANHVYTKKDEKYLFEDAKRTIGESRKYFEKALNGVENGTEDNKDFLLRTGYRLLGIGCELMFKSLLLNENYSINKVKNEKVQISPQIIPLKESSGRLSYKTISLEVIFDPNNIKKINVNFDKFDSLINKENKQMLKRQSLLIQKNKSYKKKDYPAENTDSSGILKFIHFIRNQLIHSNNLPPHFVYEYENVIKLIKYICKEKNKLLKLSP